MQSIQYKFKQNWVCWSDLIESRVIMKELQDIRQKKSTNIKRESPGLKWTTNIYLYTGMLHNHKVNLRTFVRSHYEYNSLDQYAGSLVIPKTVHKFGLRGTFI